MRFGKNPITIFSRNKNETQKIAKIFAREITRRRTSFATVIIALSGNLGSGKTTFVQGFARPLGVKENILSPTFVLMKIYSVSQKTKVKRRKPRHLIHIDCYRVKSSRELSHLGFKKILKDKDAIILIEWADRIRKLIPRDAIWFKFKHGRSPVERIIQISN